MVSSSGRPFGIAKVLNACGHLVGWVHLRGDAYRAPPVTTDAAAANEQIEYIAAFAERHLQY